jgi:regulator of nonsense transcripts 2
MYCDVAYELLNPQFMLLSFQACLDDFSHHNIDVACNLLETCGRFLYRSPETSIRMGNMLEILMRLKNVKNLDPRHSTLVENAYYLCKPPERSARVAKVRPPLHQVQCLFQLPFLSLITLLGTNNWIPEKKNLLRNMIE